MLSSQRRSTRCLGGTETLVYASCTSQMLNGTRISSSVEGRASSRVSGSLVVEHSKNLLRQTESVSTIEYGNMLVVNRA